MRKITGVVVLTIGLSHMTTAFATGIPVVDGAHIGATASGHASTAGATVAGWAKDMANFIETKAKWVQEKVHWVKNETELGQTVMTLLDTKDKVQESIDKMDGVRKQGQAALKQELDMGDGYLPDHYDQQLKLVDAGLGNGKTVDVLSTFQKVALHITDAVGITSDDVLEENNKQAGLNRSLAEMAYTQGSMRHAYLVGMESDINSAEEAKDIMDVQARIQLMQTQVANEQIKVNSLAVLQASQEAVERQRRKEARLESLKMKDMLVSGATALAVWNM